jgi:hypothetical protein
MIAAVIGIALAIALVAGIVRLALWRASDRTAPGGTKRQGD